jgi:DNA (cytosine-5)-methyltransferase 1
VRILDLFCGAGGAAVGYKRAFPEAEIVGVDIAPQPRYPFTFRQGDAMQALADGRWLSTFDLIHASPPCQHYSDLAKRNGNADDHPDLVGIVRWQLQRAGVPYVIENVEGAPLIDAVTLCGTMFPELRVLRHRLFECSFPVAAPPHPVHPLVFTHDKRKAHYGQLDQNTSYVQVTGGGNCTIANKRAAMGTPWMSGHGCNEAIPPAYAEHLGRQVAAYLSLELEEAA